MAKFIIKNRRIVQGIVGAGVTISVFYFKVNLWMLLAIGVISGIIFGKVFCRWMCPMGFLMEFMMGSSTAERNIQLYNYHKLGCPIAWISGLLNKVSFLRIRMDSDKCKQCGSCDKSCYISTLNKEFSLYKDKKKNPATHFSCSKCLACIEACPAKSLKYTI